MLLSIHFWGSLGLSYSLHPALSPKPRFPRGAGWVAAVVAVCPLQEVALPGPRSGLAFQASSSRPRGVWATAGHGLGQRESREKWVPMGQLWEEGKSPGSITSSCIFFPLNSHGFSPSGVSFPSFWLSPLPHFPLSCVSSGVLQPRLDLEPEMVNIAMGSKEIWTPLCIQMRPLYCRNHLPFIPLI